MNIRRVGRRFGLDCGQDRLHSHRRLHQWVGRAEREQRTQAWPEHGHSQAKLEDAGAGEPRELRQANEILRKASAYFAQAELDRRYKP